MGLPYTRVDQLLTHPLILRSSTPQEERDEDRLNDLLQKQKVALSAKKAKLEESLASFEKNLNQFYDYFHEYNKLDYFKTIEVGLVRRRPSAQRGVAQLPSLSHAYSVTVR